MSPATAARLLLAAGFLCLAACEKAAQAPVSPRPNVLLIVADDLGYNDLAINNDNTAIRTPTLDQLARDGVRFTQHYADAVCSPARAALLAGMNPARLGYSPNGRGLSPQLVTLPEALQGAGYRTMHIGKWHIGDTLREAWPDRQGFEHWFGFLNQWYLAGEQEDGRLVPAQPRHLDPWLMRDGDGGARYQGYVDDILTDEAVRQITARAGATDPWFINLWYYAPHAPLTPAPGVAAHWPDTPEGKYRAMVEQLDSNVARVLSTLEDTGQAQRTLVVFVSDNGGTAQQVKESNWPFHGVKATFWEGGLRTPLLIRWPDGAEAGRVRTDVVTIQDIYPTILTRVGLELPPGLDGRAIESDPQPARDLFWEIYQDSHYGYSLLRDGRWRLYRKWPYRPWEEPAVLTEASAPPGEPPDLAAVRPDIVTALEEARRAAQRHMHQLPLAVGRAPDGTLALGGLDFLRTPGSGGFSFAIGFGAGYAGTVARQAGIWSLQLDPAGNLGADFQGRRVQARVDPGACHSVILSAWFARRSSNWRVDQDRMRIALYVDGVNADTQEVEGRLDDGAFAEPTRIGDPGASTSNALLTEPRLFSAPIDSSDAWDLAQMHREICPAKPAKTSE